MPDRTVSRRAVVGAMGAGVIGGLAGCVSSPGGENTYLDPAEWEVDPDLLPFPTNGDELPAATVERGLADGTRTLPDDYAGRDLLLTFVYTHCMTMCPRLTAILANVQDHALEAGYADRMAFVETTFDPERDDAERLREWAESHRVDLDAGWEFLRPAGTERAREVVESTYGVSFARTTPEDADGYMFAHTGLVLLANKRGYVERAYKLKAGGPGDPVTWKDVEADLAVLREREE